ncbi:cupin domain-containing protein [Pseudoxanthomonas sp.]|uniref:(R)-mandelonitrile lyase n=1 Tax=Pseudoxanthomonas sp. TaxID=1871049 RepID=UPI002630DB47|nr:cupin domain-containing protein [Pseudoxanthomonas sp.]WDS36495.1 MAG: cupin domain-containing protein [Pseudoxanthomonas sp.]
MNLLAMSLTMMAATAPADSTPVTVTRAGSADSMAGSADYFTGKVRVDAPFQGTGEARVGGATVTFEPGARTAWHTHPLGQTLIVTSGVGCVQEWGKPIQEIRAGDTVWIPAGVKHWHGAREKVAMSHIAIAESQNGSPVTWLEQVSDAQYRGQ